MLFLPWFLFCLFMNSNLPTHTSLPEADDELNLQDVVDFVAQHWPKMVVGAAAGLILGLAGWFFLGRYSAESILINNEVDAQAVVGQPLANTAKTRAMSFLAWRSLSRSLPGLASQWVEEGRVDDENLRQIQAMADPTWWNTGVKPTFSLTKADAKDLAAISKSMQETGSADILNWVVTARGKTEEQAERNAIVATDFIMQGAAYLSVREILSGYESQVLTAESELQKKVSDTEVELKFLRARAQNMEALRQKFPGNSSGSQQVVDLRDSNAKFMPIVTQIVAVQSDIHEAQERLERMNDKLEQSRLLRQFLDKTRDMTAQAANGLQWIDQLLKTLDTLRAQASADNANAQLVLNTVQADLVRVRTHFTKGLETRLTPSVTPPALLPPLAGGSVGGATLTTLWLLVQAALGALRKRKGQMTQ